MSEQVVVVTGASGYIGGHVVKILLERGYTVRGTVRDISNTKKYDYLNKLQKHEGQLTFFQVDFTKNGDYSEALKGATGVIHTASPYFYSAPDPQKDIVQPAIDGTLSVLQAALESKTVKRVVITSSGGAVFHFPVPENYVFTYKDWNTQSSLTNNPYFYSKRLAEQAAWKFYEEHKSELEVVVAHPVFVIGPPLNPALNTSLQNYADTLLGKSSPRPGAVGWVDVRDVATGHVLALEKSEALGKRVFLYSETRPWRDLNIKLKELHPQYPVSEPAEAQETPKFSVDTTVVKSLGLSQFITWEQSVKDTFEALVDLNLIEKK